MKVARSSSSTNPCTFAGPVRPSASRSSAGRPRRGARRRRCVPLVEIPALVSGRQRGTAPARRAVAVDQRVDGELPAAQPRLDDAARGPGGSSHASSSGSSTAPDVPAAPTEAGLDDPGAGHAVGRPEGRGRHGDVGVRPAPARTAHLSTQRSVDGLGRAARCRHPDARQRATAARASATSSSATVGTSGRGRRVRSATVTAGARAKVGVVGPGDDLTHHRPGAARPPRGRRRPRPPAARSASARITLTPAGPPAPVTMTVTPHRLFSFVRSPSDRFSSSDPSSVLGVQPGAPARPGPPRPGRRVEAGPMSRRRGRGREGGVRRPARRAGPPRRCPFPQLGRRRSVHRLPLDARRPGRRRTAVSADGGVALDPGRGRSFGVLRPSPAVRAIRSSGLGPLARDPSDSSDAVRDRSVGRPLVADASRHITPRTQDHDEDQAELRRGHVVTLPSGSVRRPSRVRSAGRRIQSISTYPARM